MISSKMEVKYSEFGEVETSKRAMCSGSFAFLTVRSIKATELEIFGTRKVTGLGEGSSLVDCSCQ